jgi:hypothetical protein
MRYARNRVHVKTTAEFRPAAECAKAAARGQTVLVDGFLAPCQSWRGAPAFGRASTSGFNSQIISSLAGDVVFVSEPVTGHNHDMTALSETETAEVIAAAFSGIGIQRHWLVTKDTRDPAT